MGFGAFILRSLVLVLLVGLFVFLRVLGKRADPNQKKRSAFRVVGGLVGNALMPLHAFVHPHTKHLIVEQLKEHAEDDRDADPTDPEVHLNRQLKRIRDGEEIDRLTTLLRRHR